MRKKIYFHNFGLQVLIIGLQQLPKKYMHLKHGLDRKTQRNLGIEILPHSNITISNMWISIEVSTFSTAGLKNKFLFHLMSIVELLDLWNFNICKLL